MIVMLKNKWLWEGERKLSRLELHKISRALGYYSPENFLEFLGGKYPNAVLKLDADYRIIGRIRAG